MKKKICAQTPKFFCSKINVSFNSILLQTFGDPHLFLMGKISKVGQVDKGALPLLQYLPTFQGDAPLALWGNFQILQNGAHL